MLNLILDLNPQDHFSMAIILRGLLLEAGHRVRHGFANPRGYPGMGGTGTGTGRLKVTHRKPTPVARVWRVFPGTRTSHASHITTTLSHLHTTTDTTTRPGHEPEHNDMEVGRWGGGEKDEGGDGPSCPSP